MTRVGLYLSGNGSLDGSDVFSAVLAYQVLQEKGHEPVPVGRDVDQGEVIDHRTARPQEEQRNALSEAARIVKGDIRDMRDVDAKNLDGAIHVGGGGVLSTWTDFHERGSRCRVTERLKYQVLDLHEERSPQVCLGNAAFVLGQILRDQPDPPELNPGSNESLRETLREWEVPVTDSSPCWDADHQVGSFPDFTKGDNLAEKRRILLDFLDETSFASN